MLYYAKCSCCNEICTFLWNHIANTQPCQHSIIFTCYHMTTTFHKPMIQFTIHYMYVHSSFHWLQTNPKVQTSSKWVHCCWYCKQNNKVHNVSELVLDVAITDHTSFHFIGKLPLWLEKVNLCVCRMSAIVCRIYWHYTEPPFARIMLTFPLTE